jgi:hypothetical protein
LGRGRPTAHSGPMPGRSGPGHARRHRPRGRSPNRRVGRSSLPTIRWRSPSALALLSAMRRTACACGGSSPSYTARLATRLSRPTADAQVRWRFRGVADGRPSSSSILDDAAHGDRKAPSQARSHRSCPSAPGRPRTGWTSASPRSSPTLRTIWARRRRGVEADLQEAPAGAPQRCREGFRLVRREWPTDIGPVHLTCATSPAQLARAGPDTWFVAPIANLRP